MGLFDKDKKKDGQKLGLFHFMNDNIEDQDNYTDEELDEYGLDDAEKEHIKKDGYDPWNFDEEELEDDDYYNEDDDINK